MGSIKLYVIFLLALSVFCSLAPQKVESVTVLQYLQQHFPNGMYKYFMEYPALAADLNNPVKPFTVFAPLDSVFNGTFPLVNETNTPAYYHVASGNISPSSLTYGEAIRTLLQPEPQMNGYPQVLIVSTSNTNPVVYTINDAKIYNYSSGLENGIVYTIDRFLTPTVRYVEDLVSLSYPTLNTLVMMANVSLKIHPLTLFAPLDTAFHALPGALLSYLTMNTHMSNEDLTKIILYHGHGGQPVYTGDLSLGGSATVTTLLGSTSNLTLHKPRHYPNESVVVIDSTGDDVDIVAPNTLAYNGVLHGVNDVLIPPPSQFQFTLEKAILGLGATKFLDLVYENNLDQFLLNDTSARTLFVPTNKALANMNMTDRDSLLYHALPDNYSPQELVEGYLLSSMAIHQPLLNGSAQLLKFEQGNTSVLVNGIAVINQTMTVNTPFKNYVYLIDSLLPLPGLMSSVLMSNGYSVLAHAADVAGLDWINNASLTVFAPTDEAFSMLPPGSLGYLLNANFSGDLLRDILYGHIVDPDKVNDKIFYSTDIPMGKHSLPTINGMNVVITKTDANITVNDSLVQFPDVLAANGVAHGINRVLIPAGVTFSIQNLLEGLGNYSRLLDYLAQTGLISTLNSTNITIFAPDDDAFDQLDSSLISNTARLREILLAHVVPQSVSSLSTNDSLSTGVAGQNIAVISTNPDEVELRNTTSGEAIGSAATVLTTTYGRNGYVYGISRVLGVEQPSGGGGGLKKWQLVLIVVGSVVGGLLLLVLVLAVLYFVYHVFYKNKSGYRKIND